MVTYESTETRVNPNVNHGLWVMMAYQHRFIIYNKCTTLVGMLLMGEVVHMWEEGSISEKFLSSSQFAVKLKLL